MVIFTYEHKLKGADISCFFMSEYLLYCYYLAVA